MQIKHAFISGKGDGPDSTRVRPTNWNDPHNFTVASANRYIGRDKSGAGSAQELGVVPVAGTDDGTIWTAAKVQEYVAQQIAALPSGPTPIPIGTIVGSIVGTMPGFLPLNGQTFGRVGSSSLYESALYENLYLYLWTLNGPAIVVEGGKGANGPADWAAGKSMFLPQSAGCVIGASGFGLNADWLTVVGADTVALTEANLAPHSHGFSDNAGGSAPIPRGSTGGGSSGGGNVLSNSGIDAIVTTTVGSGTGHPNIQRTMICQVFWIKY